MFICYLITTSILFIIYYCHLKLIIIEDSLATNSTTSLRSIASSYKSDLPNYPIKYVYLIWIIYELTVPLIYTSLLWLYIKGCDQIDFNITVCIAIIVTIDCYLTLVPIRFYHFYFTTIIGLIYSTFILIICSRDKYFNNCLNTNSFELIIINSSLPICHLLNWFFYKIKIFILMFF